jgi:hypothetical protein
VNKRRATDQRAHELPSPKSRAREIWKQGGVHKKALLNRRRGSVRFNRSDPGDLIVCCSSESCRKTKCLPQLGSM